MLGELLINSQENTWWQLSCKKIVFDKVRIFSLEYLTLEDKTPNYLRCNSAHGSSMIILTHNRRWEDNNAGFICALENLELSVLSWKIEFCPTISPLCFKIVFCNSKLYWLIPVTSHKRIVHQYYAYAKLIGFQ